MGVRRNVRRTGFGAIGASVRRMFAAVTTTLTSMVHGVGGWITSMGTFDWIDGSLKRPYRGGVGDVRPDQSSIVLACLRWIQRTITEAPPILEEWVDDQEEWQERKRDPLLTLLERPNPYYNYATMMKALIADRYFEGTAYVAKIRSSSGRVVQLWWLPAAMIEPVGDPNDPTVFIDHYVYTPNGKPLNLREDDVVRLPDGMDPANPRKGLSAFRALMREIYTDEEAASMTSTLLHNMGVPGVIISPESGTIRPEQGEEIKKEYIAKTTGDKRGEPLVLGGSVKVTEFGFSPEQMQLRSLRGIPEERITAVLGVNAAVVGLGAGLATTKVGATLREYREEAFESTIIPLYRELASEFTHQLLVDFKNPDTWRVAYDLSKVRVLQDDENKRAERVRGIVNDGIISVAEGRRALGFVVEDEHNVYLRRAGVVAVPAGKTPDEQLAISQGGGLDEGDAVQAAERALRR